jgi:hypothetical protein
MMIQSIMPLTKQSIKRPQLVVLNDRTSRDLVIQALFEDCDPSPKLRAGGYNLALASAICKDIWPWLKHGEIMCT